MGRLGVPRGKAGSSTDGSAQWVGWEHSTGRLGAYNRKAGSTTDGNTQREGWEHTDGKMGTHSGKTGNIQSSFIHFMVASFRMLLEKHDQQFTGTFWTISVV